MDSQNTPQKTAQAQSAAELEARRAVVKQMLRVAAAAPMAALLFDPRKARADGTGIGGDF